MLYEQIKELARKKGVSIYRIERDTKMSNGTISKWNEAQPSALNLKKVADYLGVPIEVLLATKEDGEEK